METIRTRGEQYSHQTDRHKNKGHKERKRMALYNDKVIGTKRDYYTR